MPNFRNFLMGLWIFVFINCSNNDPSSVNQTDVPVKPDGMQAVALSATEIFINWEDNSSNEDGFIIEASAVDKQNFIQISNTPPNILSFTLADCTPSCVYFFRVYAFNNNGNSDFSAIVSVSTPDLPPRAPSNLRYTNLMLNSVDLFWTDNSDNEDGFKIERKPVGDFPYIEIATVLTPDTSFQDDGLISGSEYYYKVRAYNSGGVSPYSNSILVKTLELPQAPSGLWTEVLSISSIKIYWVDNSTNENGFSIERRTANDTSWTETARYDARHTTHTDVDVLPSTTYYYRLRAFNGAGYSNYSNEATARTPGPPVAPSNLTAITNSTEIVQLSWADNSENETAFEIFASIGDTSHFFLLSTFPENTTCASVIDEVLFQDYYYRIRAVNIHGNSTWSNTVTANTKDPVVFLGGLTIIDGSSVDNPEIIGFCEASPNPRDIFISNETACIAGDNSGLVIVDISDKSDPEIAGSYPINLGVSGVFVSGNSAYLTGSQSGFRILDISVPSNILELGYLGRASVSVFVTGRYACLTSTATPLKIIDVIAPNHMIQIGTIDSEASGTDISIKDQYAYVCTQRSGLKIYRINDPSRPIEVGTCNINVASIFISGDYAYATSINTGLHIIDIRLPSNPVEVAQIQTPGNAWDVCVLHNYAYVADYAQGLQIIDVSDPANPFLVGALDTDGFERCVWVVEY